MKVIVIHMHTKAIYKPSYLLEKPGSFNPTPQYRQSGFWFDNNFWTFTGESQL